MVKTNERLNKQKICFYEIFTVLNNVIQTTGKVLMIFE